MPGKINETPNRLLHEKSPYLLQHAYNPVDWYPWGEEAFHKAEKDEKPVFLSIGYSTCHWCHVMAHESFEDGEVAAALNRDYVCIKVDREERPDIDAVYMTACQMLTGSGGWPLTVIMTPEQKPFWAGTYLPKTANYGVMGLMELLAAVKRLWDNDREKLLTEGEHVTALLAERKGSAPSAEPEKALLQRAFNQYQRIYDPKWGGFGGAPKFPTPHNLLFLMEYYLTEKDADALEMVKNTLTQMFRGGIFDHIGGGFSRYSTDIKWLVPHFEKMLYDNALLTLAYSEAYHITGDKFFAMAAERTLDYVLSELTDEGGGFYCGQDADSDGVEGKYYVFTKPEILHVLGEGDGAYFCNWFGVTDRGNFEGENILNLLHNPGYAETGPRIKALSQKLYDYRMKRTRLHKDDKVLTSWNGLMIAALAKAGWLLEKPEYTAAAKKAYDFIQAELTDKRGGLMLRWREGEAAHDGQLDDYAFYAYALLELYRHTWDVNFLRQAEDISRQIIEHFEDRERGGLFLYSNDGEQLISRPKETYDGAMPSGNSVAAVVFGRLSKLTGDMEWQQASRRQISFLAGAVQDYPAGHSMAMLAVSRAVNPSFELVCATARENAPEELSEFLRKEPLPNMTIIIKTNENAAELEKAAPFTAEYPVPEKGDAYYLCHNGTCRAPVYSLSELTGMLWERLAGKAGV